MDEHPSADEAGGLDRRSLIKKAGAGAAAAVAAPLVIQSVFSPAAAASAIVDPPSPCEFDYFETFDGVTGGGTTIGSGFQYVTYGVGPLTGAPGWTVTSGNVDAIATSTNHPYDTGGFADDTTVIELGGSHPDIGAGTISRVLDLPCAGSYVVEFDWSNPNPGSDTGTYRLDQGGQQDIATIGVGSGFTSETRGAIPLNAGPATISFSSAGLGPAGVIVDNVHVHLA